MVSYGVCVEDAGDDNGLMVVPRRDDVLRRAAELARGFDEVDDRHAVVADTVEISVEEDELPRIVNVASHEVADHSTCAPNPIFRVVSRRAPHVFDFQSRQEFLVACGEKFRIDPAGTWWPPPLADLPAVAGLLPPMSGGRHDASMRRIVVYWDASSILCERCGGPITRGQRLSHPYHRGNSHELFPMFRHFDEVDCRVEVRPDVVYGSWDHDICDMLDVEPEDFPTHREAHARAFRAGWSSAIWVEDQGGGAGEAEEWFADNYRGVHDTLCRCSTRK